MSYCVVSLTEATEIILEAAAHVPRVRKPTKPTKGSQRRRVDTKVKRGQIKATRGKIVE